MIRVFRIVGFVLSAIGVQIASGIGLAALVCAIALGWFRVRLWWLTAPVLAGALAAVWLFEDATTGGKVVNAQSNFIFVVIVYAAICGLGYTLGRIARRRR